MKADNATQVSAEGRDERVLDAAAATAGLTRDDVERLRATLADRLQGPGLARDEAPASRIGGVLPRLTGAELCIRILQTGPPWLIARAAGTFTGGDLPPIA
jgi:hypothetical protein